MVTGFEHITIELNQEEIVIAHKIASAFSFRKGKEKAITNAQIVKAMQAKSYKVNDTRIRKIIQYIRVNYLVKNLVASNKGYYVETNEKEIAKYKQSLRERIQSMEITLRSFNQ